MGSGKYADEGVVVEVEQQTANDAADEQRHDGDEGSYAYPSQTFGGKHGADEVAPDTESYAGQEDTDAELADHEVRGDGVVSDELVLGAAALHPHVQEAPRPVAQRVSTEFAAQRIISFSL